MNCPPLRYVSRVNMVPLQQERFLKVSIMIIIVIADIHRAGPVIGSHPSLRAPAITADMTATQHTRTLPNESFQRRNFLKKYIFNKLDKFPPIAIDVKGEIFSMFTSN